MSYSAMNRILICKSLNQYKIIHKRCISFSSYRQNIRNNILYNPNDLEIPRVSLPEYIYSRIEPYTDLIAFECPLTHRKFTFGEVRKNSKNVSKALRKKFSLNKGDVALIYLPNCPEFPIAAMGCLEAGIIVSTANSLYTPDEIARQLKDSSAKIILTYYELYDNAAKAVEKLGSKLPIICVKSKQGQSLPGGAIDFTEIMNSTIDIPDLDLPHPNDIAILPYSSGTTGLPKGVELSHLNIVSNLAQTSDPEINVIDKANGQNQEVIPGILPMFHIYGFTITTLNVMINGAKLLTLPRFQPNTFVDILKNYSISSIFAAPPLILFMTLHPDVKVEYFRSLKTVMSGAAPLGALDEEKFLTKTGNNVSLIQGYGLTETSPVVALTTKTLREQYGTSSMGSTGKVVIKTEAKIVGPEDKKGQALGANQQGELLVRGPQVMQGYHNNPEATQGAFLDGWFKTGDLAYYDENGLLFITDRVKELIKVRGFQVAPAELEELLRHHPKVADAAVIGIPHELSGEVPRAYIQAKGEIDIDDLYKFVAEKVAKYKQLEGGIELVKEIPKNSAGKILRKELKQKFLLEQKA